MKKEKEIKCIVWDLDGTLWDGILLEGDHIKLKPKIKDIIKILDSRGILHSIASKNAYEVAMEKLREFGIKDYFLYPEISWNAKSSSIGKIQANLNISMDSILFIDDEVYERDEVNSEYPDVMCIDSNEYINLLDYPRLNPKYISEDSTRRRSMYKEQIQRKLAEEQFIGPRSEFLESLGMRFSISKATEDDLKRAEELTIRTNQLNTTGKTYDFDELKDMVHSPYHKLYICELQDKYGYQGKIGLALVEITHECHHIRLFIMSCRVISYGLGTVLLTYLMNDSRQNEKLLRADFKHTGKNRAMFITFKMSNFKQVSSDSEDIIIFENDLTDIPPYPSYLELKILDNTSE